MCQGFGIARLLFDSPWTDPRPPGSSLSDRQVPLFSRSLTVLARKVVRPLTRALGRGGYSDSDAGAGDLTDSTGVSGNGSAREAIKASAGGNEPGAAPG